MYVVHYSLQEQSASEWEVITYAVVCHDNARYKSPKADVLQVSSNILGLARFLFSEVHADMCIWQHKKHWVFNIRD